MNHHLWIPQPAAAPAPSEFAAYLRQHGWTLGESTEHWCTFSKPNGTEPFVVEVPQLIDAPDYPRAARTLIENLSRIAGSEPSRLLRDIRSVALDIIRFAIDSAGTRDGRIGVETGRRVYEATRDLLLAAACSVDDSRPVFPRKKANAAMDLIRRARLGQTEVGSFVITVECEIAPNLQSGLFDEDPSEAPLERRTSLRLAQAMASAGAATREATGVDSIEPFRRRIPDGVSANLCEAIAEILDAADADSLRTAFSFASRRPVHRALPTEVSFSRDAMSPLREAARQLRDEAIYPAFEAEGHVIKLHSNDVTRGGIVVLHSEFDGGWRHVQVELDPDAYRRATDAHKFGDVVRCTGDLERVGRSWTLLNPRRFAQVEER